MTDGTLNFDTKVDTGGFNQGTESISKGFATATKGVTTFVKALAGLYVVKKAFDIGKEAIEFASDLQEVQNVVDTAFGEMSYKAEEFADIAIEQFGMSALSAKQTSSTFMAMAKSMGLSMDSASDMAIEVAKLSGDVASFYNISQDEAATKLKSIFTGETETLKQIGVVMTETNLQEFALTQGITKNYSAMSQAEKVSLRYQYVMNALSDASGDFAKTSSSWANQTRILSEKWKELLGILGNGLLQVLTPMIQVLNTLLSSLISVGNALSNVFGGQKVEAIKTATAIQDSAEAEEALADATAETNKEAQKSEATFDEIKKLNTETADGSSGVTSGGSAGIITTTEESKEGTNEVKTLENTDFKPLTDSIQRLKDGFGALYDVLSKDFKWVWDTILVPFGKWTVKEVAPPVIRILGDAFEILAGALEDAEPFLTPMFDFLEKVAEIVGDALVNGLNDLADAFDNMAENSTKIKSANEQLEAMKGKDIFVQILCNAFWVLQNAIEGWQKIFYYSGQVADDVWKQITNLWTTIGKWFDDNVVTPTTKSFNTMIDNIKKLFTKEYWMNKLQGFATAFKNVTKNTINAAIDLFNRFISWLNEKLKFSWDAFEIAGQEIVPAGSIQLFTIPKIPRLATGTVVPANFGEFQAILGDNKKEPEVVSPLSTMKQAFIEAMQQAGGSGNQTIVFEIDGVQFGRMVNKYGSSESKRKGVSLRSV